MVDPFDAHRKRSLASGIGKLSSLATV